MRICLFVILGISQNLSKGETSNLYQKENSLLAQRKKNKPVITETNICIDSYQWSWAIECDSGVWVSGYAATKKEAKKAAKNACKLLPNGGNNYEISIMSPFLDDPQGSLKALVINGHIEYLDVINPWTDEFQSFTQDDISANALAWLSEICDYPATLSSVEKVVAQLKVWDIYLGGNTITEILPLHNLNTQQFNAIATKSWSRIIITQTTNEDDDETVHLDWIFEY